MKKINETYIHETTGIKFDIETEYNVSGGTRKRVRIDSNPASYKNIDGFVFNRSSPETIIKIATALLEIGEFTEKL